MIDKTVLSYLLFFYIYFDTIHLINKLDCDQHFDGGLQRFREDLRVIFIISQPG